MTERSKSISLKQLRSAVHDAAAAAARKHPAVRLDLERAEIINLPYWICGIPVPWPIYENAGFTATFGESLAANPAVSPLREGIGDLQVAAYSVGSNTIIGVRGGPAALSE